MVPLSILMKTLFKAAVISTFQGCWKLNSTVHLLYSILLIKTTTKVAKHSTTKLSWLAKTMVTSGVVRAVRVTKVSERPYKSAGAVFCNYVFCSFHPSCPAANVNKDSMLLCACANDNRAEWLRAVRHGMQSHAPASKKKEQNEHEEWTDTKESLQNVTHVATNLATLQGNSINFCFTMFLYRFTSLLSASPL